MQIHTAFGSMQTSRYITRPPNTYSVEIQEYGKWFECRLWSEDLAQAIEIASSLCGYYCEDDIRIVCPDGTAL